MTNYLPPTSLRFRFNAGVLEYKPTPNYHEWLTAWDISGTVPLDIQDQLDAIAADVIAAAAAAAAAQTTANTALTNAATAQTTANTAITNAAAAAAAAASITPKNRRVTMWHHEANVSGGSNTLNISAAQIDGHTAFSTVQGFNAYQSFDCDLMPACKLFFIGNTGTSLGIMGIYLDGGFISSIDWYASPAVINAVKSISFAASSLTAGRHTLRLEVATKHASSSGYSLVLTKYWLAPDTD